MRPQDLMSDSFDQEMSLDEMIKAAEEVAKSAERVYNYNVKMGGQGYADSVVIELDIECDLLKLIAAMAEELKKREWRPIETAPKDGTHILCAADGSIVIRSGYWHDKYNAWFALAGGDIYPSVWMPIIPFSALPPTETTEE